MYVTDANGKVVQFSYFDEDSDEDIQPNKNQVNLINQRSPSPIKVKNGHLAKPEKKQELVDIDDIENDNELKIYKKLTEEEKRHKVQQQSYQGNLNGMKNLMQKHSPMFPSQQHIFEQHQVAMILEELQAQPSLKSLLTGIRPESLNNEEIVLLSIWSSPLVTTVNNNDEYSIYARGILGVDVIQAQGLLRNCDSQENHLINVVESYFKLSRSLPEEQFLQILRNAVYNLDKAYELKQTLETLGENWFNLKEQIKALKLFDAPKIENTKLVKVVQTKSAGGVNAANSNEYHEVDILIRLLPYFDVPLAQSTKIQPEANEIRKLLGLAKTEAEMIQRKKKGNTLIDIITMYFDQLLLPETSEKVEQEYLPSFYNSKQKTKTFVSTLNRIVWEYNYVNKMFVEHYKNLSNLNDQDHLKKAPPSKDILIFGGHYPFSIGQLNAIVKLSSKNPNIKGLSLNFTRIKNQGMQQLAKGLNLYKWKSIRIDDELLYSLDLTNNFIDQDGFQSLLDVFFDSFDVKTAVKSNAPIPTSIRVLTLDFNFLGKGGADVLGTILSTSRQLKTLSLNRTRIIGKDLKRFCLSLAQNQFLRYLNMGQNKLGDVGLQYLSNALKVNTGLAFLDLFDADFGEEGAISLAEALLLNKSLVNLRLCNTHVGPQGSIPLLNAIYGSQTLKVFRWANLLPLPTRDQYDLKDPARIFQVESRNNALSRGVYLNPKIGDLTQDFMMDVFKCQFFERQAEVSLNEELDMILQSYCDYAMGNWQNFETGQYKTLIARPTYNYKTLLNEDIIRDNLPELCKEEKILVSMDSMEIESDLANQFLVEQVNHHNQKSHQLQISNQMKKNNQNNDQVASNNNQLQKLHSQLDSIPSFNMSEFYSNSPFTKNLGKELLIMLLNFGLNINYYNSDGLTPIQIAIKLKLRTLQKFLLSDHVKKFIPTLNLNLKTKAYGLNEQTPIHMAVNQNDYDLLKMLLEYKGDPKPEFGLKDSLGRNPCDLAIQLDYQSMIELLEKNGASPSIEVIQKQIMRQQLQAVGKTASHKKIMQDLEPKSLFSAISSNNVDRFQKLILIGEDINQRDALNQTPLHCAVINGKFLKLIITLGRETMVMILLKQNANVDARDVNGMTPLHLAAYQKENSTNTYQKIIERLVSFGASIDAQTRDGSTALHLACQAENFYSVKLLCQLGAHIGVYNYAKQTPYQVTPTKDIKELLQRVLNERKMKNPSGSEEYFVDFI